MGDGTYVGLKDWDLFKYVDAQALARIRLCHIFSETRSLLGAIYINTQDQAFARGCNGKHCKLGLPPSHIDSYRFPETRIPELENENIRAIATVERQGDDNPSLAFKQQWGNPALGLLFSFGGYRHGAALSENGNVFFWGLSLTCIDFKEDQVIQRPKIMNCKLPFLKGELVKQIACSGSALAMITESRRLFVWGFVDGSAPASFIDGEVILEPSRTSVLPMNVVGGGWHFAVTTTSRRLYTFGNGATGALGYEWNPEHDNFKAPRNVTALPAEPIGHVACSQSATLVYIQPWLLFIFGANSHGELGLPPSPSSNIFLPSQINLSEAVQTVYASLYNSIFYASTLKPKRIFRWGYDTALLKPQIVESRTPISCFANRALPIHTSEPDSTTRAVILAKPGSIVGKLEELGENNLFSDLTILLRDGTTFKAHRYVLYTRSEHFKMLLEPCHFAEGQAAEIDMTAYDPDAYRTYLHYVYKGCVGPLSSETLIHLFMIADEYLEIALREYCHEEFKSMINTGAVSRLYRMAKFCGSPQLASDCYDFAMKNMDAIIAQVKEQNLQAFLELLLNFESD